MQAVTFKLSQYRLLPVVVFQVELLQVTAAVVQPLQAATIRHLRFCTVAQFVIAVGKDARRVMFFQQAAIRIRDQMQRVLRSDIFIPALFLLPVIRRKPLKCQRVFPYR